MVDSVVAHHVIVRVAVTDDARPLANHILPLSYTNRTVEPLGHLRDERVRGRPREHTRAHAVNCNAGQTRERSGRYL